MPTVEATYLRELREGLSDGLIPIFEPDTAVEVGAFGSFESGRFVVRGTVFDRGLDRQEEVGDPRPTAPWSWASTSGVTVGPSLKVPGVGGGELVETSLTFARKGGVAVSYGAGEETAVKDADRFAKALWKLWWDEKLPAHRFVVWRVRTAPAGTVIVAVESGATVKASVDAAKLAAIGGVSLGLPELHLAVGFQADRGSTYLKSNADGSAGRLVQWVSLFGLSTDDVPRVIDAHAFEGGERTIPEGSPVPIGIDAALATVAEDE